MVSTPDRRIAVLTWSLAALVFCVLLASVPKPHRSDARVLRALVQYLDRSDRLAVTVTYEDTRRVDGSARTSVRVDKWYRPSPYLDVALAGGRLAVTTVHRRVGCIAGVEGRQCFDEGVPDRRVATWTNVFALVQLTGEYTLRDRPNRRFGSETAQCFEMLRASPAAVSGFGDRSEFCYSRDGLLLYSRVEIGDRSDTRIALRWRRGVDASAVERVLSRRVSADLLDDLMVASGEGLGTVTP